MAYRKSEGCNVWHWCKNCSRWPETDYEEHPAKPYTGELCNECQALSRKGTCTPHWL